MIGQEVTLICFYFDSKWLDRKWSSPVFNLTGNDWTGSDPHLFYFDRKWFDRKWPSPVFILTGSDWTEMSLAVGLSLWFNHHWKFRTKAGNGSYQAWNGGRTCMYRESRLTALFTKPPASCFPAVPWFDWYYSIDPPFCPWSCQWWNGLWGSLLPVAFWEQPVTKEPVALWPPARRSPGWNNLRDPFLPAAPFTAYGSFRNCPRQNHGTAENRAWGRRLCE